MVKLHALGVVKATQLERTNLTLIYNDTLKETSDKLGYNYIDITEDTINEDTQLIDDDYLNEDKK